jgi:hypothetical protein
MHIGAALTVDEAYASVGAKPPRHFTAPAEEYNAQSALLRARSIRDDEDEA